MSQVNCNCVVAGQNTNSTATNGTYSLAGGQNCNATRVGAISFGSNSQSLGDYTTTFGYNNLITIPGAYSTALGINNTISGETSYILGSGNTSNFGGDGLFGFNNLGNSSSNILVGRNNESVSGNGYAFGQYLKNSIPNTYLFGSGLSSQLPMTSIVANSMHFGVNSPIPTMSIVGNAGNVGFVGIGTQLPVELLHLQSGNMVQSLSGGYNPQNNQLPDVYNVLGDRNVPQINSVYKGLWTNNQNGFLFTGTRNYGSVQNPNTNGVIAWGNPVTALQGTINNRLYIEFFDAGQITPAMFFQATGQLVKISKDIVSTPTAKFEVQGNTTNTGADVLKVTDWANNPTPPNTMFLIKDNGKIGIGTTNPSGNRLTIVGSGNTSATNTLSVTSLNGNSILHTLDDGSVGIGTTSPVSGTLTVNKSIVPSVNNNNGGPGAIIGVGSANDTWYRGYGVLGWTGLSDKNFKTDIVPLSYGLKDILKLNSVSFKWKNSNWDSNVHLGLIAQDLYKVIPEVVEINEKGEYMVTFTDLIPVLIKGIQELNYKVDSLQMNVKEKTDVISFSTQKFQIFPNPNDGIFYVKIQDYQTVSRIVLFDTQFNKISETPISSEITSIDSNSSSSGTYIVIIYDHLGNTIGIQKVITNKR